MRSTPSDWKDELAYWLKPFLERLGHKARRRMCPRYVAGLIGPGDRKSVQPMKCVGSGSRKLFDPRPKERQRFKLPNSLLEE